MKATCVSDLHLEFDDLVLPGGELLILAGDACELRSLRNDLNLELKRKTRQSARFFQEECPKYDRVIYIMGNHEHYHNRFNDTAAEMADLVPSNVTVLEKDYVIIGDYLFMGGTLWTDMCDGHPIVRAVVENGMNDFRCIKYHDVNTGIYRKFRTQDAMREFHDTISFFQNTLKEFAGMKTVIVTHHAPSHLSVAEKYKFAGDMNFGYYSSLENFILDNEQIKLWVHGHMHNHSDYMVGNTRVVCNPRGYAGYEDTESFNTHFTVDLD